YPSESNSWEPESTLINAPKKIAQYHQGKGALEGGGKANVRNVPEINQIITGVPCWGRIEGSLVKDSQFNEDFPPLIEEKKN
ncbi:hypothetical protein DSO57_1006005, partial [Entomophthora muscae]